VLTLPVFPCLCETGLMLVQYLHSYWQVHVGRESVCSNINNQLDATIKVY